MRRNALFLLFLVISCLSGKSQQTSRLLVKSGTQKQQTADAAAKKKALEALKLACNYAGAINEADAGKQKEALEKVRECIVTKAALAKLELKEKNETESSVNAQMELQLAADPDLVRALNSMDLSQPAFESVISPNFSIRALDGSLNPSTTPTQQASTFQPNLPAQEGMPVTQDGWHSPDACSAGDGNGPAQGLLRVHRSLMFPKDVSDDFGRRMGRRFIVYEVVITNTSKDYEYEIGDIVVDLKPLLVKEGKISISSDPKSFGEFQAASQDLDLLRGIPEKGQDYDPRNLTLHIFQGIGAVGGAVSGLTPFSDVMGSAVGDFSGAFVQAIGGIFPDHTSTQLNRLSDLAFTSNALIGKLQTKKYAIFIPDALLLDHRKAGEFWSNPHGLLQTVDLDQVNVCVDGLLLVQAKGTPDPAFSTAETNVAPNTTVAIRDMENAATIYYTVNGDVPTMSSTQYKAPIPVGAEGSTLKIRAFAVAPNLAPSNTVMGTFTVAKQASTPRVDCGKTTVTITPASLTDAVYYTTDGTPVSRSSSSSLGIVTIPYSTAPLTITAKEVGSTTSMSEPQTQTCPAKSQ